MKRRGFTLVEICIVIAIIGIMCGPFLMLTASTYRQFKSISMTASLKTECDQAGYDVLRLAASGRGWKVDADNHGATFANGSRAHFASGALTVTEQGRTRRLPLPHLSDCCMMRNGSCLEVTISVRGPQRPGGQPIESHGIYRFPVVEAIQ